LTVTYKVGEIRTRIVYCRHGAGFELRASSIADERRSLSGYSVQKSGLAEHNFSLLDTACRSRGG